MNISKFVDQFKDQFVDSEEIVITPETKFRTINSWDSLTGMSIIVMIEGEYKVKITDTDFKSCDTVEDVFNLVKERV